MSPRTCLGRKPIFPFSTHARRGGLGVTRADGKALPNDNMPASVVLPVGRFGPAFLAYDNFQAYLKWNNSLNYSLTAAYLSTRLDGAPAMNKGASNVPKITFEETREIQEQLKKRGYDVGRVDGVLGLKSRVAIRDMQGKFGQPADGWPTAELLGAPARGRQRSAAAPARGPGTHGGAAVSVRPALTEVANSQWRVAK